MAKGISLRYAKARAKQDFHNKEITSLGFEQRELGPHTINVFYFSVEYDEIGTHYRADVYADGKRSAGLSFG